MLEGGQKSLYRLRSQSWAAVQSALAKLLEQEEKVRRLNMPAVNAFYWYAEALSLAANEPDNSSPLRIIDRETIRLLDVDLVDEFVRDPTDEIIRDNLAIELRLLVAGIGSIPNMAPYTIPELKAILQGEGRFYDDSILLLTLRRAMEAPGGIEYASLMLRTLPPGNAPADLKDRYWWDDALILAGTLQLVWRFFPILDQAEQEAVLQHYLYRSLVLGAPVRLWVQEALSKATDETALSGMYALFTKALLESQESVPLDREATKGKNLADIYREYLVKVYNEDISALAQEKFISDFYQNAASASIYALWLREAVNIFAHLKKGNFI